VSRPSRSSKAGNRGRHRHIDSPETRRWLELAATKTWLQTEDVPSVDGTSFHAVELIAPGANSSEGGHVPGRGEASEAGRTAPAKPISVAPPPKRPPWLDPESFEALMELRERL
jgi:hypothetical protein